MKNNTIDILIDKVLSKQANNSEQAEFEEWLNESEGNKSHFEQSKVIWNKLDDTFSHLSFNKKLAQAQIIERLSKKNYKTKSKTPRFWIAGAASVVILLGVFALIHIKKTLITYTATNKVEQILLPDSSEVWLNKNSQLSLYKGFNKRTRKLALEGEAFFNVKRNIEKPFKVYTEKTVTTVLGTSFNIHKNEQEIVLTVASGKVSFEKTGLLKGTHILQKGDAAKYNIASKEITLIGSKNTNYLSWKTGVITFYDTPLIDVCKQLNKQYNSKIRIVKSIENLLLTGEFNNEELIEILETIEITLDLKSHKTKDNNYLIKPLDN